MLVYCAVLLVLPNDSSCLRHGLVHRTNLIIHQSLFYEGDMIIGVVYLLAFYSVKQFLELRDIIYPKQHFDLIKISL